MFESSMYHCSEPLSSHRAECISTCPRNASTTFSTTLSTNPEMVVHQPCNGGYMPIHYLSSAAHILPSVPTTAMVVPSCAVMLLSCCCHCCHVCYCHASYCIEKELSSTHSTKYGESASISSHSPLVQLPLLHICDYKGMRGMQWLLAVSY